MKNQPNRRLFPLVLAALVPLLLAPACGKKDDPVAGKTRLCGGDTGFGARLPGVDVCVPDQDVSVALTSGNRYNIRAAMTSGGSVYEFQLLISNIPETSGVLTIHYDLATAIADDRGVWIFYQEIPAEGDALESYEIALDQGNFTLGVHDGAVVTASFTDILFKVQTQGDTPEDRGTRVVSQGFMSLSVD